MKSTGVCLGASRISTVTIEEKQGQIAILTHEVLSHEGNVADTFRKLTGQPEKIAVTGRKCRNMVRLSTIPEAEAVEHAYQVLKAKYPGCDTIVSAGGETFMVYQMDSRGKIINAFTGNKCACGTGEFFLQQLKRMNLSVQEALDIVDEEHPYRVAGRCSVFCKSDCTHALNKGEAKGRVVAGLCSMMAAKILELLHKCNPCKVLCIGGTSQNHTMIYYLRQELAGIPVVVADEAAYFEAFGTAVWALQHDTVPYAGGDAFARGREAGSFAFFPALADYEQQVVFKQMDRQEIKPFDQCIIGLDVGSTTTKAILLRTTDDAVLASVYLRTNGDPVGASRECYRSLQAQVQVPLKIIGLGTTGSGRAIAGLHAQTEGVVNEIIAHATAAVHFDAEVDTIFEIGGQDAKYTYITNKVPSDYAMNEACSAGTGSFLEEAAKEAMGIETSEIGDIALRSRRAPNFNDQCAAFIGSNIKTAIQEGINQEDIVSGLVYAICQNYVNRVKGNRLVGKKIFMQGGVCYNKAVPVAMAALTGKTIIVPPEPGLMGAFGVALDIKQKLRLGLLEEKTFDLGVLAGRGVSYGASFICSGAKDKCDRKCVINQIIIDGRKYPFGGACNKYYNLRKNLHYNAEELNYVALREKLIFERYVRMPEQQVRNGIKVGMIKSLMVNTLYPLYHNFFTQLGYEVVLSTTAAAEGMEKKGASFCYPVEQAHGFMEDLLKKDVDIIFLPHVMGLSVTNGIGASVTCPFVQGEPYYLKTAFPLLREKTVLSPMLYLEDGAAAVRNTFVEMAASLGHTPGEAERAYNAASAIQEAAMKEMKEIGRVILQELRDKPEKIGIVLFGRAYNACSKHANMGIPPKFASRGQLIFPWEFLEFDEVAPVHHMFWATGQMILKAAALVRRHPQLFAAYITNFSCGPDSFIVSYFRDAMGQKPSLTLELDSHTADAGIDTRIEAFLDVINSFCHLPTEGRAERAAFSIGEIDAGTVVTEDGRRISLADQHVEVIVPSMGAVNARLFAASLRYAGVKARSLPPAGEHELSIGRANASCKECLPYMLVLGSILNDLRQRTETHKVHVYFVTDSSGPCRFGQYHISLKALLAKQQVKNVAVLSLTAHNGYAGLGGRFQLRAWQSIIIGDVLMEVYSALLVLAKDKAAAKTVFNKASAAIEQSIATDDWDGLKQTLKRAAQLLGQIPLEGALGDTPKVALLGEIFVRVDGFSNQYLAEKLAEKGIMVKVAPIAEFVSFCDYLLQNGLYHVKHGLMTRMMSKLKTFFKQYHERMIKEIIAESGLYEVHMIDVPYICGNTKHLISPRFTAGDTTLTVAAAVNEIIDEVAGVVNVGPFGCMPSRISEAIISERIADEKISVTHDRALVQKVLREHPALPFLSIECDGNPFPLVVEAKLEIFCLQVERMHRVLQKHKQTHAG